MRMPLVVLGLAVTALGAPGHAIPPVIAYTAGADTVCRKGAPYHCVTAVVQISKSVAGTEFTCTAIAPAAALTRVVCWIGDDPAVWHETDSGIAPLTMVDTRPTRIAPDEVEVCVIGYGQWLTASGRPETATARCWPAIQLLQIGRPGPQERGGGAAKAH